MLPPRGWRVQPTAGPLWSPLVLTLRLHSSVIFTGWGASGRELSRQEQFLQAEGGLSAPSGLNASPVSSSFRPHGLTTGHLWSVVCMAVCSRALKGGPGQSRRGQDCHTWLRLFCVQCHSPKWRRDLPESSPRLGNRGRELSRAMHAPVPDDVDLPAIWGQEPFLLHPTQYKLNKY